MRAEPATPVKVVLVTMDSHLGVAAREATDMLRRDVPGLEFAVHAADEWAGCEVALAHCHNAIADADIVITTMLFLEDHAKLVLPQLAARRPHCDAMLNLMSCPEVMKLTRIGKFDMAKEARGPMALLKKLRGNKGKGGASTGAGQMRVLRELPKLLRFIPGTAQDLRAYFLGMQYWLSGSSDNIANLVRMMVNRYASGSRAKLAGKIKVAAPVEYPDVGLYHPDLPGRVTERLSDLPALQSGGRVGVLLLRSYVLAGNAGHYDGAIAAMEARGMNVVPAFVAGLDSRAAIENYFMKDGVPTVDAVVSLTGFSLVGGPAYNDSKAAEEILTKLDVPYLLAHPLEFQTIATWRASNTGLTPVEATMMVAIPELDGAIAPITYGGRCGVSGGATPCPGCDGVSCGGRMLVEMERSAMLAARVGKLVDLRRRERAARKVALVIFNFPPNAGNTGTAAYLAVFESLHNTLGALKAAGYTVDVPQSVDALRESILKGNAEQYGALANVAHRIPTDTHVRRQRWLPEIEKAWGPAPGRQQADGASIHVLGAMFGNAFIGVQPGFGYEGDPMRLLFEAGFAPTHAFAAFYTWLREDFKADAVLHFGTHGALEFMPGKQTGLSAHCWPDRLIADLPNYYLYASNNPSEGMLAKRRAGATLISYLTPPVASAGLYKGLLELKASIDRWRALEPGSPRESLAELIQLQAAELELAQAEPFWAAGEWDGRVQKLGAALLELEYTLIPNGLHVIGKGLTPSERRDTLDAADITEPAERARIDALLAVDAELPAIIHALDAGYIKPVPGGDLLRSTEVLPTGRNLHGFDPFKIPSAYACKDGAMQAERVLARHKEEEGKLPETVAVVLWGTDNLKAEGGPIAQVMWMMGARPRHDSYGRLTGAQLIPLEELGRPRVDVMISLSGIFRDLLPLQTKLLAEAALLAAQADEPAHLNYIRAHALDYLAKNGGTIEEAALRVFGNSEGAYGANVNLLVDNAGWQDEDELGATYTNRKGFAYGVDGKPRRQDKVLNHTLGSVDMAYQNLDSVETGVTTISQYFDSLGGISRAVAKARGKSAPVYISDQTKGAGQVRTLNEQVSLETRTRGLNPKWYEALLSHGYEGVRQIEEQVSNTLGWSATTGQVSGWVYTQLAQTYMLDPAMRARLAELNPTASAKIANRLLEANERNYWQPDEATLDALRAAGQELEDRLEGITPEMVAA